MVDQLVDTPITTAEGVGVMARRLLEGIRIGDASWDEQCALAILAWVGRQTGRDETGPLAGGAEESHA